MLNPHAVEFSFASAAPEESKKPALPAQDENNLTMLFRIFPDLDDQDLFALYCLNDNDLMRTVESLVYAEPEEEEDYPDPSTVVCKYFLAGQCLVKNCEFMHSKNDRSAICKFWLKGYCMRGSECIFLHSLDEVVPVAVPEPVPEVVRPVPIYREPIVPDKSRYLVVNEDELNLAARMKLDSLRQEFSRAPPKAVFRAFAESGCELRGAREKLTMRFGAGSSPAPIMLPKNPVAPVYQHKPRIDAKISDAPQLGTGSQVDKLYKNAREEAEMHCRARNTLLMRATQAYLAGDGALAKELSRQGREHAEQAEALHADAAESIFESRNRKLRELVGSGDVLDLHGLHPEEASIRLWQALDNPTGSSLCVVTGTGRHTSQGESRLRRAIRADLVKSVYRFEEVREGGAFKVLF